MRKTKRRLSVLVLLVLLLAVTVGYSALSATLNISGTSRITNATWDVHFENVTPASGSVTATSAPSVSADGLSISYSVELAKPGDYYEFTVDVKNSGSVNAKLSALPTLSGVSSAQDVYTNYTMTHSDGTAAQVNETIAAGQKKTFKVRVEFDPNVTAAQLPTTAQTMTLTASLNYVQA